MNREVTLLMADKVYLASTSPRRIELIHKYIPSAIVLKPLWEERMPSGLNPEETVMFLARQKAESVLSMCDEGFIIGLDTVVYNGRIIGKPRDRNEAIRILEELRNREHLVLTGGAVIGVSNGMVKTFCEKTCIRFDDYSMEEIENYVDTGESFDKAGSYALHLGWRKHAIEVNGDFENAIGFPWRRIKSTLESMGYVSEA